MVRVRRVLTELCRFRRRRYLRALRVESPDVRELNTTGGTRSATSSQVTLCSSLAEHHLTGRLRNHLVTPPASHPAATGGPLQACGGAEQAQGASSMILFSHRISLKSNRCYSRQLKTNQQMKACEHNPPTSLPHQSEAPDFRTQGRKDQTFQPRSTAGRHPSVQSRTEKVSRFHHSGSRSRKCLISPQLQTTRDLLSGPTGETLHFHVEQLQTGRIRLPATLSGPALVCNLLWFQCH